MLWKLEIYWIFDKYLIKDYLKMRNLFVKILVMGNKIEFENKLND